jgi:integrase
MFGNVPLVELQHDVARIAQWRATLPPGYAYQVTAAFRQIFDAAIRWRLAEENPVRASGPNRQRPRDEVRPFEVEEIERLATELGPYGPLIRFAAWTGLRPCEWVALRWEDVSLDDDVVTVRRTFADGQFKDYGKTLRSRRRVSLSARAADAVRSQRATASLVFTAPGGGVINLDNFRRREWHPALRAAGLDGHRIYDLRHTFASWALDAGVSVFELARFMGTGARMIDRTYGHLVRESEARLREKLDRWSAS